jgi:hypothetical protein
MDSYWASEKFLAEGYWKAKWEARQYHYKNFMELDYEIRNLNNENVI